MTSIAAQAKAAAFGATQSVRGVAVTFARGGISIEISGAVQGRTEWKGMAAGSAVVIAESTDWLIPAARLVDGDGNRMTPQQGDTITVETDKLTCIFDVQPFGPDQLFWRWHDRDGRSIYRIFTKLLSEQPREEPEE